MKFFAIFVLCWSVLLVPCGAGEIFDDFSGGAGNWEPDPDNWSVVLLEPGRFAYRGDTEDDSFTCLKTPSLTDSWKIDLSLTFRKLYADNEERGIASIGLFPSLQSGVQLLINFGLIQTGQISSSIQWFDTDAWEWNAVLDSGWVESSSSTFDVQVINFPDSYHLGLTVWNECEILFSDVSDPIAILPTMDFASLRVNHSRTDFENFHITTQAHQIEMLDSKFDPEKGFKATLIGLPGRTIRIEKSHDLVDWEPFFEFNNATGRLDFTDPSAKRTSQNFYRSSVVP